MTRWECHPPRTTSLQLKLKTIDGKIRLKSADLVRLRARLEAVCRQSGLRLRALSDYGSSNFGDQGKTVAVNLIVGQTES